MPRLVTAFLPAGSLARHAQPCLGADELLIRPWAGDDAAAVADAYRDPAVQRWHARTMTAAEARDWVAQWPRRWAEETGAGWAVTAAGVVLGQVSVRRLDLGEGRVEFSYWVVPAGRGRAVAPRALTAVTAWLFRTVGVHRAELAHSTRNPASCRVAVKAGFALEGVKRQEALHADGWHDMHLHARLTTPPDPPTAAAAT